MLHIEKWKVVLIYVLSILGILYALPNVLPQKQLAWAQEHLPSWMPVSTVNLGLDLRGGSHLLMQADTAAVQRERMQSLMDTLRSDLRKSDIAFSDMKAKEDGVTFTLVNGEKDEDAARKVIRTADPDSTLDIGKGKVELTMTEKQIFDLKTQVINQSIEIVRRRVDESGTKEPVIQRQGADRIVVQLPGVDDPEHIKALIGKTAKMGFHLVDMEAEGGIASPGTIRLPMRERQGSFLVVQKRVMVTGDRLTNAQPAFGERNQPVVSFAFDAAGGRRFCEVTKDNINKPFAIVLDNEIISAPVIEGAICGGRGQISGTFSVKEATDLALLLRAGALPAPLTVVEERSVGPTLGSDSISSGKTAAVWAFVFVALGMALCYGLFGWFANLALALNVIFIFAILSILQATLTLPGIAGIILTIGIAVDANVLIYERIREELRNGRTMLAAIDSGYKLAMATIVDANLTTLIVAMILFSFGTGPVKGFAVAMSVGVVTSMFSAIMITRLMVIVWLKKYKPTHLTL